MELVGLVIALVVAGTAVGVGARRSPQPPGRIVQYKTLGLGRPAPIPSSPPLGQDARDMLFDSWVIHPGYAASAAVILQAFRLAEAGDPRQQCDLFDDLCEPDCHLASLFEKRNEAVSGKPWSILAGGQGDDAELAARVLRDAFSRLPMVEVFQHLLTFNKYGWSAVEIDWGLRYVEGRWWVVPTALTCVRARRFKISSLLLDGTQDELRLYADISRPRGDALRPYKWITIRRDAAVPLACSGLMRNCAWPALGKRKSFRDWIIYAERFGLPKPVASYEGAADSEDRAVAEEIVSNIGNDVGAVKPKTVELEWFKVEGDNSKIHGGLIAHCNAEESKRVNGSTLANDSSGSSGASYALGAVHDTVRWEAVQYDETRMSEAFGLQVFVPFMTFNGLAAVPAPTMHIQVVRDLDPGTRVDVATKFKNLLGGKVSSSQMSQELGFREPTDDKDALPGAPVPQATPAPAAPHKEAA